MQHELVRNAKNVSVSQRYDDHNHPIAHVVINDKYEYEFSSQSRVSRALEIATPEQLGQRLTGGQFFFMDGILHDFRDGHYNGFVHTDESIKHLMGIIGFTEIKGNMSVKVIENVAGRHDITLGRKWSNHGITVPGYHDGGEFTSELHFGWNPFVRTVNSMFAIVRMICSNGAFGTASILNTRIPLFNRWEEHLEIANKQIQTKISNMSSERFKQMGKERASVAETALIAHHAHKRLTDKHVILSDDKKRQLHNIFRIAEPSLHLGHVYRENVFLDNNISARHPAHLSVFDTYNLATELRSHSQEVDGSSNRALDKFANTLVFDHKDLVSYNSIQSSPKMSSFSDPRTAFFGLVN